MKIKTKLKSWMLTVTVAAIAFVLVSCGGVDNGVIIKKEYQPARIYTTLLPVTVFTGKTSTTIMIPHTIYDDEDFVLLLKNKDDTGNVFVTKSIFESVNIGEYFNGATIKENNRKERKGNENEN